MEIRGYFTNQGLELSAKLLTGATMEITRVTSGGSSTETPASAASLAQEKQVLAANQPIRSGNTVTIPVTLAATLAETAYTLTELGVYARDPERGEILYKVYRLSKPVDILPDSRLVLRFYLEETVSEDLNVVVTCSPAGLITETELAQVQKRLDANCITRRQLSIDVSELQRFLNGLPRLLTESIDITVSGTLTTSLTISDFYGDGELLIRADAQEGCTIQNQVTVKNCSVFVYLQGICAEAQENIGGKGLIDITSCPNVRIYNCSSVSNGDFTQNGYGIAAGVNSMVVAESVAVSGFNTGIFVGRNSLGNL